MLCNKKKKKIIYGKKLPPAMMEIEEDEENHLDGRKELEGRFLVVIFY